MKKVSDRGRIVFGSVAGAVVLFGGVFCRAGAPGAPDQLRVCDVAVPVGTGASPSFGWHVNDTDSDEIQAAYQVLVSSAPEGAGDLWDSGKVASRLQNHIAYAGIPLSSDQACFWKVRTWDKDGHEGAWSGTQRFVVGLLDNAEWSGAKWIRRNTDDADDYTYYRKSLEIPAKPIERATAYVTGVHKYALYVNGTLVGKGPAYHHPQYQYYNAFDITAQLKSGAANQLAVFNHWFGGGQGRPESARGILFKAIIHYTDGSCTETGSDGSWKQCRAEAWMLSGLAHRNKGEGIGYVEKIDARKLIPDWMSLGFDDSSWEFASEIGAPPVEPWTGIPAPDLTRIQEYEIKPVSITRESGKRYLVDFGKVYAGRPRIAFSGGAANEQVEMLGGYVVDKSGRVDPAGNQSTDLHYFVTLSGEDFVFEPEEYLGMRYLQVDDSPMPLTADNVSFIVRHSVMAPDASSFESPDETLNAVWELMKHSLLTCAMEEFVDTPTREKGGFLADSIIQSTVAMPVMNERALTQRTLVEFIQSMEQYWSDPANRGRMNAVYPNHDGARDIPDFTQAYPVWVWNYYMETGDRTFLETCYDRLKDIADYVYRHQNDDTGLVTNLTGGKGPYEYGIVDWPATMRYGYEMTAARTVVNGWAYADYRVLGQVAGVLDRKDDQKTFEKRAEKLAAAMNEELTQSSGVYVDGLSECGAKSSRVSQHANMFPLALGIVPNERRTAVLDVVKEQGIRVGMVTMPMLIRALGESGAGDQLVEILTDEKEPGWAQCLAKGATATWEAWDADTTKQSRSHAWGASGLEAYVRYILGIRPLAPQYEEVLIQPLDCGSDLDWAKGHITTDRGPIYVHWKLLPEGYALQVTLPANVIARIALPKGSSSRFSVYLDGKKVRTDTDGNFVIVSRVGSGEHTLVRKDG
ncbi:MAG: family 78 glycoside hydrolase catalytic domain [Pontiellaceae bacterium]|nr:family 78 glycoside hydrolase catalytic domain [Pontiellaceae bacterium]MBN2784102.1 family 78 glycoside hydrolase catalytic domain [Pontiellaceae bacterium]